MKKLFACIILCSLIFPLDYSSLSLYAEDQSGNPVEGVGFFLSCKMTLAAVERHLCTSGANGSCMSPCMDCAPGEGATVYARYEGGEAAQGIATWSGVAQADCNASLPLIALEPFIFQVEETPGEDAGADGNGTVGEGIAGNTDIETHDYYLGNPDEEFEYDSYLEEKTEEEEEEEGCMSGFALLVLAILCARKG